MTTWCVFSLQDAVLTGMRQAVWLPLENGVYGLAKIGLLVALAPVAAAVRHRRVLDRAGGY